MGKKSINRDYVMDEYDSIVKFSKKQLFLALLFCKNDPAVNGPYMVCVRA